MSATRTPQEYAFSMYPSDYFVAIAHGPHGQTEELRVTVEPNGCLRIHLTPRCACEQDQYHEAD